MDEIERTGDLRDDSEELTQQWYEKWNEREQDERDEREQDLIKKINSWDKEIIHDLRYMILELLAINPDSFDAIEVFKSAEIPSCLTGDGIWCMDIRGYLLVGECPNEINHHLEMLDGNDAEFMRGIAQYYRENDLENLAVEVEEWYREDGGTPEFTDDRSP